MCWCVFPIENASDASASQRNSARLRLISGATLAHCLLDHSECLLAGHQDRNGEAHHFYMERSSINGYIYIYIYISILIIYWLYICVCIIHQHWLIGIGICTCREIVQCLIPAPKLHLSIDDPRSCLLPQDSPTQKKVLVALTFHDHFKRDIVVTCFYDLPRCINYNTRIPWYIYIYIHIIYIYIYIYIIYICYIIYILYYIYIILYIYIFPLFSRQNASKLVVGPLQNSHPKSPVLASLALHLQGLPQFRGVLQPRAHLALDGLQAFLGSKWVG